MKKETKETLLASVNSTVYAQMERLLMFMSQNMQGKEVTILFDDGISIADWQLLKDELNIRFETADKDYLVIFFGHLNSSKVYEISLWVPEKSSLYNLVPKSILTGMHKSLELRKGFTITVPSELPS